MSHSAVVSSPPCLILKGTISWTPSTLPISILVDSGADDNFIDSDFAAQSGIPSQLLPHPKRVFALDGRMLAHVTHRTITISLQLSGNHHEAISFF